ncbi:hypothetical protein CCHL11_06097 [Colletotrichum chlorophyti]|uniref:LysM domain-containing protein n=1 Tax=Colletotrichum chlorophyti TaxID=708187 RepID=A0A1Q8RT29_9PEZI|nr:hypothetical protein CCHL11_06097 [Colletotrichum chlorophyti]
MLVAVEPTMHSALSLALLKFYPLLRALSNSRTMGNASCISTRDKTITSLIAAHGEYQTAKVNAGDSCWAGAQRCAIPETGLKRYTTRSNFCEILVFGEIVCCSSSTLPDTTPPPNSDWTCQTQTHIKSRKVMSCQVPGSQRPTGTPY